MAQPEHELRGQITQQQQKLEEVMIRCTKAGKSAAATHLGHAISNLVAAKAVLAYVSPAKQEEKAKT